MSLRDTFDEPRPRVASAATGPEAVAVAGVPLASWNPDRQNLYGWLETQIIQEYPQLSAAASATGESRARALLTEGLILPVLDGLDEIRAGGRGGALAAINITLRNSSGVVLSCRAKAFRHAVRPGPATSPVYLEGAAGIQLCPLTPTDVADYLIASPGAGGQARWATVRTTLTGAPIAPLTRALTTPLMASLARTIYNPRPGERTIGLPNPADLCALPTWAAVEQHLFDGLIPAAYRPQPGNRNRWTAQQATRYLTFLAKHLEHRLHTTSLAWWELERATPRTYRVPMFALALVCGLAFGFFGTLALVAGLAIGLVGGLKLERRDDIAPQQIALSWPSRADLMSELPSALKWGLIGGLATGIATGIAAGSKGEFAFGLKVGFVGGLTLGLAFGLVGGLAIGFVTEVDINRSSDPRSTLIQDRTNTLVPMPTVGLAIWLVSWFAGALKVGLVGALVGGFVWWLAFAFMAGGQAAWGRLWLARFWLAARGRQPLAVMAFLADAQSRGVLRQAGAVWQFRHANLQRHLANRP